MCTRTQKQQILFDADLCAACEASAEARRPFNRTAASRMFGPGACIDECDSFCGSKWSSSKVV
jgi:hypothetical protein